MKYVNLLFTAMLLSLLGCSHKNEIRPERRDIVDAVFGSGHLENKNQYTVMANTEGFVKNAYVVDGDTVKVGQRLFQLDNSVQQTQVQNAIQNLTYAQSNASLGSPQIEQLKLQIAQAVQKLNVDSANYGRYSRLVKTHAVSNIDYDNARLTYQSSAASLKQLQKSLADLQHTLNLNVDNARANYDIQKENNNYNILASKAAGVVMNVNKKVGDYIKKGDAVAVLGTGRIIIKLDIAESDITRLKLGERVLISLNSQQDRTYEASISKIYPSFNTTDQAFIAEAEFKTAPAQVLNGTQLQANIIIQTKKNALMIPSYCIINDHYVMLKGGKEKKKVNTGIRTLEWTEITGGISESDVLTTPKKQ
jgi:multidrug efflux pump subunit AcrA (membrane-fusion protein)